MSNRRPPDEQSATITRRKFTLSERLDADLQQLAARHYQGNVSLCLRAAVKDHKSTLNGEGRIALQRLEREMSHLREIAAELTDDVAAMAVELDERDGGGHDAPTSVADKPFDDAQRVLDELHTATTPLRGGDLTEHLELSPRRITHALEQLIDIGLIVESPDRARYQPIMMQPITRTDRDDE